MRLYLSSYQLGDHPEQFTALVRGAREGWVIANALDAGDEERRRADTVQQISALGRIGLIARDLDLRDLRPDGIRAAFGDPDFVWVRGGNVFVLRAALARSGLDRVLVEGIVDDRFVYAGFSAGACVLSPTLRGLEPADPVEESIAIYGDVRRDGLGVLDRPVVPHVDSPEHPGSALLDEIAARYAASGQLCWTLRDGQALLVDGATTRVV